MARWGIFVVYLVGFGGIRPAHSFEAEIGEISIGNREKWCLVSFKHKNSESNKDGLEISATPIEMTLECANQPSIPIDTYEINGGAPHIAEAFVRRGKFLVVLVRWHVNSKSADFGGDFYLVNIYQIDLGNSVHPLVRRDDILGKLAKGLDGELSGNPVNFPLKDKKSISKRLERLGL